MAEIRESRLENKRLHAQVRSLECQLTAMALIKNINRSEASSTFAAVARAFPGSVDVDELRARAEPAEELLKHHTSFISVPDHDVKVVSSSARLSQPLDSALDSGQINDDHEAQSMFCTDSYAASTNKEEAYLATIARLETELGVAKRHIQEQKDELIAWQVAAIHDDDTLPEHEEHLQGISSSAAMVSARRPPPPPINAHRANIRRLEADARLASQFQDQAYLPWSEGSVLQSFQSAQSSYAHGAAPPVLSSGDATMHSGYLLKCSRLMKNWQRRFFVFYKQERVLNYFGNDRSAKKGAVSLRHSGVQVERAEEILQIASGAVRALPRNVQKMPALHLRVLSPAMDGARARVMWLAATCEEDRERWIRVLLANES